MGIRAFYSSDNGINFDNELTMKEVMEINEGIESRIPWRVMLDGIYFPEYEFGVHYYSGENDGNTLAWLINKVVEKNEGILVNGEVCITWDCDDEMTILTIQDNKVFEQYRIFSFSEKEEVQPCEKNLDSVTG